MKKAEEIYSNGNFNYELLKDSIERIYEEKKMKREINKKIDYENKWDLKFDLKSKHSYLKLLSLIFLISFVMVCIHYLTYSKKNSSIIK